MDEQQVPAPAPVSEAPKPTEDPGKNLAIIGLVLAFIFALVGLILCIVARNKSQSAGFTNTIATVGIVVAVVNMIAGIGLRVAGVI